MIRYNPNINDYVLPSDEMSNTVNYEINSNAC